jgi:salicylate hydroxylase
VSIQPTELIYRDGRSGGRIAAHPGGADYRARFGAPYWGIHRVDLQQTLAAAVDPENLHLARAVTGIADQRQGATITLDGPTEHADRGPRRRPTSSSAPTGCTRWFAGMCVVLTVARSTRARAPSAVWSSAPTCRRSRTRWRSSSGPHAHLLHYLMGGQERDHDTVNFFAVLCGPAQWSGGTRNAPDGELLAGFAGWHPAVVEMLGAVEQSPQWPLLSQPPLSRWTRGRVVLIGDACHVPHHGQGANQSIEDAVVLADLLAGASGDISGALGAYPRRRRGRTRAVARSAWETGTLLHLPDDDVDGLKERDERFAGYLPRNAWVHEHRASTSA